MEKYDIFISYRRTSYETANLIATRLKAAGYSVFFDMETLRSGKFNEQLFTVIENCKDFLVVLPPNALDRCKEEDDWVRLEVCKAMEGGKNIIPVMLNGFTWPNPMPEGMEELQNYQALAANSVEYFDLSIERLQKRYLESKPHVPVLKLAKLISLWITSIVLVLGIVYGVFYFLSLNVCQKYATIITNDTSQVHLIVSGNKTLEKEWEEFVDDLKSEDNPKNIAYLQEGIINRIDFTEKELKKAWNVDSARIEIDDWHRFLLSFHGINSEEIAVSSQFATLYYKDYLEQLNMMRNAAMEPNVLNLKFIDVLLDAFPHTVKSYYAAVLSEMSNFPESALSVFNNLALHWTYFPKEYKIGEEESYYEAIITSESNQADDLLSRYSQTLEKQDADLRELERRNERMEQQMEETFEQFETALSDSYNQANQHLELQKKSNDEELALRREKLNAKKVQLEASRAELEELDKQYVETYEKLRTKCTIEEGDDQWYKWGKIRRWGMFLDAITKSRQNLEKQGIYSSSSIKPEVVYADLNAQLSIYQIQHPESKEYVAATKEFFKELYKGKRKYAGVLIFGFKDDVEHPTLRKGDIIIKYNQKEIKNYDDFKTAYKENKEAPVLFQRLENGIFVDKELNKLEQTDVVGFIELTE